MSTTFIHTIGTCIYICKEKICLGLMAVAKQQIQYIGLTALLKKIIYIYLNIYPYSVALLRILSPLRYLDFLHLFLIRLIKERQIDLRVFSSKAVENLVPSRLY